MRFLALLTALSGLAACAPPSATPPSRECPRGTRQVESRDFDGTDVESSVGCVLPDGTLHGPAREKPVSGALVVGQYDHGLKIGTWSAFNSKTRAPLGSYEMVGGSGVETLWWNNGQPFLRGELKAGHREGTWRYFDDAGRETGTEVYEHDRLVRSTGHSPFPSLVSPSDACPPDGGADGATEGCD